MLPLLCRNINPSQFQPFLPRHGSSYYVHELSQLMQRVMLFYVYDQLIIRLNLASLYGHECDLMADFEVASSSCTLGFYTLEGQNLWPPPLYTDVACSCLNDSSLRRGKLRCQ